MSGNQAYYVKSWLGTYANKNTRRVFSAAVKHFLSSVYGEPVDNGSMEQLADLHDRPPKSASAFMSGVRSWLEFTLDVELSKKQMKLLRGSCLKAAKPERKKQN